MLSCLTTATTIDMQAASQTIAPVPAVDIPGVSGASSVDDPEKSSGYPVEDPKESSGYPVEIPDFRVDKREHYGAKPDCIPSIWTEKQIKRACECLELSAPSFTTTVTRIGPSPTAIPAAGKKPQGPSGAGPLGGLLGGVLRRIAPAADDANCVTETTTTTATRTVTQTTMASTVTRTETAVATGAAVAAASSGAAYRRFTHPFAATTESGFGAAFFRDQKNAVAAARGPFPAGLTFASSAADDAQMDIAGLAPFVAEQAALVVQGFFLAPQTGPYTFATPGDNIDNWGYLYVYPCSFFLITRAFSPENLLTIRRVCVCVSTAGSARRPTATGPTTTPRSARAASRAPSRAAPRRCSWWPARPSLSPGCGPTPAAPDGK